MSGTPRDGVAHCAGLAWLLDIVGREGSVVAAGVVVRCRCRVARGFGFGGNGAVWALMHGLQPQRVNSNLYVFSASRSRNITNWSMLMFRDVVFSLFGFSQNYYPSPEPVRPPTAKIITMSWPGGLQCLIAIQNPPLISLYTPMISNDEPQSGLPSVGSRELRRWRSNACNIIYGHGQF
jgi:hypothetical protein